MFVWVEFGVRGGEGQWGRRAIRSGWFKNEGDEVSGKTEKLEKLTAHR
jgi:hypothetical protein